MTFTPLLSFEFASCSENPLLTPMTNTTRWRLRSFKRANEQNHTFQSASMQRWHLDPLDLPYQRGSREEMSADLRREAMFRWRPWRGGRKREKRVWISWEGGRWRKGCSDVPQGHLGGKEFKDKCTQVSEGSTWKGAKTKKHLFVA